MLSTSNISIRYGKRVLFDEVSIKFVPGNCYGIIGANGAGKSTFLKVLSGEIDAQTGTVDMTPGQRLTQLKQNQLEYDAYPVLQTVLMGYKKLYDVMQEKDALYAKEDFTDKDGERAADLEALFAEMDGWNMESDAAKLLSDLEIGEDLHNRLMGELEGSQKVRVLLAQALFGNPDILLLDEPTNNLDLKTINWLIDFLADFKNIVLVVSHDRYFLDSVCTHVADIDFSKIKIYAGNYTFWYESSQLAARQRSDQNKKTDEKRKELEEFIRRFSANVAKSKQATARQKMLDKLTIEEIQPSNRKYPYIAFKPERELGDQVLQVEGLSKRSPEGDWLFRNITFTIPRNQKALFIAEHGPAVTALFNILGGSDTQDEGQIKWGVTTNVGFFPHDNSPYFAKPENLVDWLREYSTEKDESYVRGFLGKMLFSGDEALKKSNVLSGGEKVRCMMAKLILQGPNVLIMDEPTDHLDLESITVLNQGLQDYKGSLLLKTRDYQIANSTCERVIELLPQGGQVDSLSTLEEYYEKREAVDARR